MLKGKFIPFEVETHCASRRMISIGEVSEQLRVLKTLSFVAVVYSFVPPSKDGKPLQTVNGTEVRSAVSGAVEEPEGRL